MLQENTQPIIVNVSGPEKKGGHYIYSIVGTDKNGDFNTVRRYSDFDHLRSTLFARWPGCYIPSLPEKKFIGNEDSVFIEMRKNGLYQFFSALKTLPHLWYSEELQLFLRKISDTQKQLQKMKQTPINEILQKYKTVFSTALQISICKDLQNEIIQFQQYLKKSKGLLENLEKMTEQIFNSRKKFNEKYFNLLFISIPDYEKNCMQVYLNENNLEDLVFTGHKKEKLIPYYEEIKKKTNTLLYVMEEIKRQKQQILAFQDVLKTKQSFSVQKQKAISKVKDLQIEATKIHAGKQSVLSKIKGKSKEDQLKSNEARIQKAQNQQKNLTLLCEIITVLIGQYEIDNFKKFRQNSYYRLLKKLFLLQKEQNQLKQQLWKTVLKEQSNEKEELDGFFEKEKSPAKSSPEKNQKIPEPESIGTSEDKEVEAQIKIQEVYSDLPEEQPQQTKDQQEQPQQVKVSQTENQKEQQKVESKQKIQVQIQVQPETEQHVQNHSIQE